MGGMQPCNDIHFSASSDDKKSPRLTKSKIRALEEADFVTPVEKARLLALLCSKRWLTELEPSDQSPSYTALVEILFTKLELPWEADCYTKKDGTLVRWIGVGANKAVLQYLRENRDRLSVMEAGLLYGYPSSAIIACAGMFDIYRGKSTQKSTADRALGGLFSATFRRQESAFLYGTWQDLRKVSPLIVDQAEKYLSHSA